MRNDVAPAEGLILANFAVHGPGGGVMAQLNTRVPAGSVLVVMGPSGTGKSTLLAGLSGMLPQGFTVSGSAAIGACDLLAMPPHRRGLGVMFQDPLLLPHLSVGQNLAFGMQARGRQRRMLISQALAGVGLSGFESRDPASLSGGQKARVALQRMLLSQPRALLLDEPFSSLDTDLREQIRQLVFETAAARRLPVVLVTHDKADAQAACALGGELVELM